LTSYRRHNLHPSIPSNTNSFVFNTDDHHRRRTRNLHWAETSRASTYLAPDIIIARPNAVNTREAPFRENVESGTAARAVVTQEMGHYNDLHSLGEQASFAKALRKRCVVRWLEPLA
jgi:hypothetical protein